MAVIDSNPVFQDEVLDHDTLMTQAIQESLKMCQTDNSLADVDNSDGEVEDREDVPRKGCFEIQYEFLSDSWRCKDCAFSTESKSVGLAHLRNVHISQRQAGGTVAASFTCDLCGEAFCTRKQLSRHKSSKHLPSTEVVIKQSPNPDGTIPCPICKETFKYTTNLDAHVEKCQTLRDYTCPKCNKIYKRGAMPAYRFNEKVKRHDKVCVFPNVDKKQCPICEKKFFNRWSMKRHLTQCRSRGDNKEEKEKTQSDNQRHPEPSIIGKKYR